MKNYSNEPCGCNSDKRQAQDQDQAEFQHGIDVDVDTKPVEINALDVINSVFKDESNEIQEFNIFMASYIKKFRVKLIQIGIYQPELEKGSTDDIDKALNENAERTALSELYKTQGELKDVRIELLSNVPELEKLLSHLMKL